MKLSEFDFILPEEYIARYPLPERTSSRLLCVDKKTGDITHKHFSDLIDLLQPNDLLVLNNTRVIPARIFATKATGGKVEILVERIISHDHVLAHLRSSKGFKEGTILFFDDNITAVVECREEELWKLRFEIPINHENVLSVLHAQGEMPLPPYFKREAQESDTQRYQTVFAQRDGAVAAPTAGLHFDDALLEAIKQKKCNIVFVTLHVGAGTFQPIRVDDITQHKMHFEWMEMTQETCDAINETKASGGRVVAVGTTSVRSIETAASKSSGKEIMPFEGNTNLFIYPGFCFRAVDVIVTNFHLPKSSLLLLVSAFSSKDIILNAYQNAIEQQYRFFSYGDAMCLF